MIIRWFVLASFAVATAGGAVLETEQLKVHLRDDFPHVLRYEHKATGGFLLGAGEGAAAVVEINGEVYTADTAQPGGAARAGAARACRVEPSFTPESARYRFHLGPGSTGSRFDIVFSITANVLEMRLENLEEMGGFELRTLYFPQHNLVSVDRSMAGAAVCRPEFRRDGESDEGMGQGIIRWRRVYRGALAGLEPEQRPEPTHWSFVHTDRVFGALQNNIGVFPLHSQAQGDAGATRSASVWNGVYHRRAGDAILPLLRCAIAIDGDQNGDRTIDWVDGATWLRRQIPDLPNTYDRAYLYKIGCCRLPDSRPKFDERVRTATGPIVTCTFDQALERIREFHHLTDGAVRQIVYLVGWQHHGHDDKYPDLSVVNPLLGGRERLVALMEAAKRYNAIVSLHVNFDDAYEDSPAWDPEIICRTPDGQMKKWGVFHNQQSYHISHYKDVRKGSALRRIDDLVTMLPLTGSIHIDAFRYTNESWESDGRRIDLTAEHWGAGQIIERFGRHGISVTVESFGCNPGLVGLLKGSLNTATPTLKQNPFTWFLTHRKWIAAKDKAPEKIVFGDADIEEENTDHPTSRGYYTKALLWQHFRGREMRDVTDDGRRITVDYEPACTATYDRKTSGLRVESDGIVIARDGDRFVPVDDGRIFVYSGDGGPMEWRLPAGWKDRELTLHQLDRDGRNPGPRFRIGDGVIRFDAASGTPYVLVRGADPLARNLR